MNHLVRLFGIIFLLNASGCATFVNDSHDNVAFSSDPDGVTVAIDDVAMGKTPCVIPVKRKGGDKTISFKMYGYKTVQYHLDSHMSGSVWGNILLGGVIGLGVDAVTGRGNDFQDSVHVILERGSGTIVINAKQAKAEAKEKKSRRKRESSGRRKNKRN